jgi:hypothetical protein
VTEAAHNEALDLLRRDALKGRAGAANALERAIRRHERDAVQAKGKLAREEKKRNQTTSRYSTDDHRTAEDFGPAISQAEWRTHNGDLACPCDGCQAYARDLIAELLL